jgi:very-short-patch-repair endonuclease
MAIRKFFAATGRICTEYSNDTQFLKAVCELLWPIGFVREYTVVYDKAGSRYRLDFASPRPMINVEIDGATHDDGVKPIMDALRDQRLFDIGWTVIRLRRRRSVIRADFRGAEVGPHWEIWVPNESRYPGKIRRMRARLAPLTR